jgi:hypothetical protein
MIIEEMMIFADSASRGFQQSRSKVTKNSSFT